MAEYTIITDNFGNTICEEIINKITLKFKLVPLVPHTYQCIYWLEDNNFIAGLLKKINSYFTSLDNRNEFIVGVNIDTETHQCGGGSSPSSTNVNYYTSYIITNYGNIYKFACDRKMTEEILADDKYIQIPDKIGRYDYYSTMYDIYIRLEKILITNQQMYDSEINDIKKDVIIKNHWTNHSQYGNPNHRCSVEFIYSPSNNITFDGSFVANINKICDSHLDNWKRIVTNHKMIEELKNSVQLDITTENDIQDDREIPEHFICPISSDIIREPVICMDGHTYEKSAIELWFQNHNSSPMTRAIVEPLLIPNYNLKSQIAEWYNNN